MGLVTMNKNLVLNKEQISQKIRRMAHQIYEENYESDTIVLVGIEGQGYYLAKMLQKILIQISQQKIELCKLSINKTKPMQFPISLDKDESTLQNQPIILIDDVLYTGKTMAYGLLPLLKAEPKSIQTAVVVHRSYKNYPIQANFVGHALATTLNEYIEVVLEDEQKMGVYIA
ncbi:MAG: phosphoribosyltransferase [Cytophagales bacterium]|nr:MAG: phosphoribosyltransferase [Cytophagales bacterium]